MNHSERVRNAIAGRPVDRTPIYFWVRGNEAQDRITKKWGSVDAFEDYYDFDCAHIFGGPNAHAKNDVKAASINGVLTPEAALDIPLSDPDIMENYSGVVSALEHFGKERGRFCYMQTNGLFEYFNGLFGIENHLMYLLTDTEAIAELYRRQSLWNRRFALNCLELGADMIHVSDDWGSQNSLLFSPALWRELIYPNMKNVTDAVHNAGGLVSLHSDGCVQSVADGIADLGFDAVHPWQESAGMGYDLYLEKYADKFALFGGICIQTKLGYNDYAMLENDMRRVFSLLKGKRWICCTTHFVQDHCSLNELEFACELALKLAKE